MWTALDLQLMRKLLPDSLVDSHYLIIDTASCLAKAEGDPTTLPQFKIYLETLLRHYIYNHTRFERVTYLDKWCKQYEKDFSGTPILDLPRTYPPSDCTRVHVLDLEPHEQDYMDKLESKGQLRDRIIDTILIDGLGLVSLEEDIAAVTNRKQTMDTLIKEWAEMEDDPDLDTEFSGKTEDTAEDIPPVSLQSSETEVELPQHSDELEFEDVKELSVDGNGCVHDQELRKNVPRKRRRPVKVKKPSTEPSPCTVPKVQKQGVANQVGLAPDEWSVVKARRSGSAACREASTRADDGAASWKLIPKAACSDQAIFVCSERWKSARYRLHKRVMYGCFEKPPVFIPVKMKKVAFSIAPQIRTIYEQSDGTK